MARRQPRRPQSGDRSQPQRHHRHQPHIRHAQLERRAFAQPARQVRPPGRLDRLHRPAAARALDQPDDRHPQLRRHLLGKPRLPLDRGIRRPAPQREIVPGNHHRPPIDRAPPEHAVRRPKHRDLPARTIVRRPSDRPDLMKAARIQQPLDPLAHRQPPARVLPSDPLRPAHLARQRLAPAKLRQFPLPPRLGRSRRVVGHTGSYTRDRCDTERATEMNEDLLFDAQDGIARITFNRPAAR